MMAAMICCRQDGGLDMYWIDQSDNGYTGSSRQIPFMCDTSADVQDLPTSQHEGKPMGDTVTHRKVEKGSTCFCINPTKLYVLDSGDQWVEAQ